MGETHITGRHIGRGTHITSDMCAGIYISRGYTYHCDTGIRFGPCKALRLNLALKGRTNQNSKQLPVAGVRETRECIHVRVLFCF